MNSVQRAFRVPTLHGDSPPKAQGGRGTLLLAAEGVFLCTAESCAISRSSALGNGCQCV